MGSSFKHGGRRVAMADQGDPGTRSGLPVFTRHYQCNSGGGGLRAVAADKGCQDHRPANLASRRPARPGLPRLVASQWPRAGGHRAGGDAPGGDPLGGDAPGGRAGSARRQCAPAVRAGSTRRQYALGGHAGRSRRGVTLGGHAGGARWDDTPGGNAGRSRSDRPRAGENRSPSPPAIGPRPAPGRTIPL